MDQKKLSASDDYENLGDITAVRGKRALIYLSFYYPICVACIGCQGLADRLLEGDER